MSNRANQSENAETISRRSRGTTAIDWAAVGIGLVGGGACILAGAIFMLAIVQSGKRMTKVVIDGAPGCGKGADLPRRSSLAKS